MINETMNDFDLSGNDDGDSSARYFVEHPALKFAMNRQQKCMAHHQQQTKETQEKNESVNK